MNVITAAEAAARLRVGRSTAYALFAAGELRGYRVGRSVRVYEDSIAAYVARSENVPAVVPAVKRRARVVPVLVRRPRGPREGPSVP